MPASPSPSSLISQFKQNLPKNHHILHYTNCKYMG